MDAIAWKWENGSDWFLALDMAEVKAAQKALLLDLTLGNSADKAVEVVTMPITVSEETARILAGKANGSVKTARKASSSAENGKKGGRPRKDKN